MAGEHPAVVFPVFLIALMYKEIFFIYCCFSFHTLYINLLVYFVVVFRQRNRPRLRCRVLMCIDCLFVDELVFF